MTSFLSSIWNTLSSQWSSTAQNVTSIFTNGWARVFKSGSTWSTEREYELKKLLLSVDLGPSLTKKLLAKLKEKNLNGSEENLRALYDEMLLLFPDDLEISLQQHDIFILVGINGAGKTTAAAKLTYRFRDHNPLLIAADTYRAAAIEQLTLWAQSLGSACYSSALTDPSAVIYQGIEHAEKNKHSPVIIDTSGRLQTHKNLMQELSKIKRTVYKKVDPARVKILLVLDGTQGQNMLQQVDVFHKELGLSGLIITKLDGSSRAGALCQIVDNYHLPIDFIGLGEKPEQLVPFDKAQFLRALLGMAV